MFGFNKASAPTHAAPPKAIKRSSHMGLTMVGIVAGFACMIPGIAVVGAGLSHLVDRSVNHIKANDEIKLRANYYRNIVGAKLGMDPNKVGVKEFMMVAQGDPTFGKVVADVKLQEARDNRESAVINSAVGVMGLTPLAPVAEGAKILRETTKNTPKLVQGALELAKMGAVTVAGSKAASIFNKEKINTQEVIERIDECLMDADQRGISRKGAVTSQLMFVLRVSQDEQLAEEIKRTMGKPFHKLTPEEQLEVMYPKDPNDPNRPNYRALVNAVEAEAASLNAGNIKPQEMAAMAPNLKASSTQYRTGASNQSHVAALQAQRAAAAAASTAMPT